MLVFFLQSEVILVNKTACVPREDKLCLDDVEVALL